VRMGVLGLRCISKSLDFSLAMRGQSMFADHEQMPQISAGSGWMPWSIPEESTGKTSTGRFRPMVQRFSL